LIIAYNCCFGGEVRGQLVKAPDCAFSSEVVDIKGETFDLEVYPNPVTENIKVKYSGNVALYNNSTINIRDIRSFDVFKIGYRYGDHH